MYRFPRRLASFALRAAGAIGCGGDGSSLPPVSRRPVTDPELRASAEPKPGWATYGYAWNNQRYVPLTEVNRETVGRLRKLWHSC